jgi:hypothetical protein
VLSQEQRSVLTGTLLGDAGLPMHGRHPRLFIKHKKDHESLALLKYGVFREYISMSPNYFDQRLNGRSYPCVQFVTRTHPESPSGGDASTWDAEKWFPPISLVISRHLPWLCGSWTTGRQTMPA